MAKEAITKNLEDRYTDPGLQDCLHGSTALGPRFKSLPYLDEDSFQKIYSVVTREIMEIEEQVFIFLNYVISTELNVFFSLFFFF